jgi:hypothetical protein
MTRTRAVASGVPIPRPVPAAPHMAMGANQAMLSLGRAMARGSAVSA